MTDPDLEQLLELEGKAFDGFDTEEEGQEYQLQKSKLEERLAKLDKLINNKIDNQTLHNIAQMLTSPDYPQSKSTSDYLVAQANLMILRNNDYLRLEQENKQLKEDVKIIEKQRDNIQRELSHEISQHDRDGNKYDETISKLIDEKRSLKSERDTLKETVELLSDELGIEIKGHSNIATDYFILKEKLNNANYEIDRVLKNVKVPIVDSNCEETIKTLYGILKEILKELES